MPHINRAIHLAHLCPGGVPPAARQCGRPHLVPDRAQGAQCSATGNAGRQRPAAAGKGGRDRVSETQIGRCTLIAGTQTARNGIPISFMKWCLVFCFCCRWGLCAVCQCHNHIPLAGLVCSVCHPKHLAHCITTCACVDCYHAIAELADFAVWPAAGGLQHAGRPSGAAGCG